MQQWFFVLCLSLGLATMMRQAMAADDRAGQPASPNSKSSQKSQDQPANFWGALQAQPAFKREGWNGFYRERKGAAYWVDPEAGWFGGARLSAPGKALLESLLEAGSHGLNPHDYAVQDIQALQDSLPDQLEALAAAEVLLMRSYLLYYRHLLQGRYPELAEQTAWHIPRNDYQQAQALKRLADMGPAEALRAVMPTMDDYAQLRQVRLRIQKILAAGGWPQFRADGLLRPGMRSEQLPRLRERLRMSGDLPDSHNPEDPEVFDEQTVAAFRAFQRRHGIEPDGVVGPKGRAMLNLPAARRLAQIDANLERLRWLPRHMANDRLMVNIAAHTLQAYRGGQGVLNMRVVVGDAQNQTPAFADVLQYIEVNPYWSIPNSIVVKELAPQLVRNINYLDARKMRIYESWDDDDTIDADDIDWDDYTDPKAVFPHVIRQDPGPWNSLGRIKFMFPNKYSIYLHDTPETELFRQAERTFSHGCIRLEKPMELADLVLRNTRGWNLLKVKETLASTKNTRIELGKADRMQIYIYYITAWVDADGELNFSPDQYQQDERLVSRFLRESGSMMHNG